MTEPTQAPPTTPSATRFSPARVTSMDDVVSGLRTTHAQYTQLSDVVNQLGAMSQHQNQRLTALHQGMEQLQAAVTASMGQPRPNLSTTNATDTAPPATNNLKLPATVKIDPPEKLKKTDATSLDTFFAGITNYLQLSGLDPTSPQAVAYAVTRLDGNAAAWLHSLRKTPGDLTAGFSNLEDLRQAMFAQFVIHHPKYWAYGCLRNLTQRPGDITGYIRNYHEIRRLLPEMPEEALIYSFGAGLQPKECGEVKIRDPKTLDEAMQIALHANVAFRSAQRAGRAVASSGSAAPMELNAIAGDDTDGDDSLPALETASESDDPNLQKVAKMAAEAALNALTRAPPKTYKQKLMTGLETRTDTTADERRELMASGRCFICKERGHRARDCPQRPRDDAAKKKAARPNA